MDNIDLHVHSDASDGTLSPHDLVQYAKEKHLKLIALTDHDTIAGVAEAVEAGKKYAIEVIPAIEFAADYNGHEFHILGLDVDYKNESFRNTLKSLQQEREDRNAHMIDKLRALGFDVSTSELYNIAEGKKVITRAHFAKLLLKKGYIKTRDEAFQKYIGEGCPAYLPRKLLDCEACIKLILEHNGIPVLAHPTLYHMSMNEIDLAVKTLVGFGLIGIEGIYPLYNSQQKGDIKAIAQKYNLKISGGSDFHGSNKPNIDLGSGIGNNISIPYKIWQDLKSNTLIK
jgi:predicted metal-dependent phosphoesterase TrpH